MISLKRDGFVISLIGFSDITNLIFSYHKIISILKETSNAKFELVVLKWTSRLCLRFVLYDMRLVNTFIIAMYIVS